MGTSAVTPHHHADHAGVVQPQDRHARKAQTAQDHRLLALAGHIVVKDFVDDCRDTAQRPLPVGGQVDPQAAPQLGQQLLLAAHDIDREASETKAVARADTTLAVTSTIWGRKSLRALVRLPI